MLYLHVTRQKVTLFILIPWMCAGTVALSLGRLMAGSPYWWLVSIAVFVAIAAVLEFLIGFLPFLLWNSVRSGLIRKPDMGRLSHFVCWLAGWEENYECPKCGYDLRAALRGYDFRGPPPDRCPECKEEL